MDFHCFQGGSFVPGIAVVPPLNLTFYGNCYMETCLPVDILLKASTFTTCTKTCFDVLLTNKATTTYVDNVVASVSNQHVLHLVVC